MTGRSRILIYGLPILAAVTLFGAIASIANNSSNRPRVEPLLAPPAPILPNGSGKRVSSQIGAVGLAEPSSQEIKIGTDVSGTVGRVFVTPGTRVNRGEPLFTLDARMAEAVLAQRRRDLATVEARLALARARVPGLEAEVQAARTAVEAARAEHDDAMDVVRIANGLNAGATITTREITRRANLLRAAEARFSEARARLAMTEASLALFNEPAGGASIAVEFAAIEQARAAVKVAETELELRTIHAPDDGTVLQINLRPGEFAQAGALSQALMVLGRTDPMHVRVDIDEADIPRYRPGAPATGSVRGETRQVVKLRFVRIEPLVVPKRSLSGQALERVDTRVMQAIYVIEPNGPMVLPGQQLDVFIDADPAEARAHVATKRN
jgi:HlyD family secretion protein